jgi:hypothetical protein
MYEWRKWTDDTDWVGLLPHDVSNNFSLRRIASVYQRGKGDYMASYYFPYSTGNKNSSWSCFKTVRGAQRWVERQLAKFWEPPAIKNPVTQ